MKIVTFCVILIVASTKHINATPEIYFKTENIRVFELYLLKVSPDLFNWTSSVVEQFR